jgi:hypothetical protein
MWLTRMQSVATMQTNERMYIVEGVDPQGRTFRGIYNEQDARYLVASNRLNKIISEYLTK